MTFIVTMIVLIAALYIILSGKYSSSAENFAYGAAGSIIGYWLGRS
jgi:hypothetical protein